MHHIKTTTTTTKSSCSGSVIENIHQNNSNSGKKKAFKNMMEDQISNCSCGCGKSMRSSEYGGKRKRKNFGKNSVISDVSSIKDFNENPILLQNFLNVN